MSTDKVTARKMVLAGLLVLALVSVYRDRRSSSPAGTFHTFWGVGVVGMFLSLLADFLPQIAGPFAALIALGSLTHGGDQVLNKALGVIGPTGSSSSSGHPARSGSGSSSSPSSAPAKPAAAPSAHPVP